MKKEMASRIDEFFIAIRGVVVATMFIGLWFWLAFSVRRFDPMLGFVPPEWLIAIGWLVAIAGGFLALSCVAVFITRGHGTPAPFDPPQNFVASGPYRYVRNPMYIGAFFVLLGAGLIVRSAAILLLAAGFWLLAYLFVILYEEPALRNRFGQSYTQYRQAVPRWLPRM